MGLDLQPLRWHQRPQFKPGDTVWVISARKPMKTAVTAIQVEVFGGESGPECWLYPIAYRLPLMNGLAPPPYYFPKKEVYATAEEAEDLARWHSVEGFSEDEWSRAIGKRLVGAEGDEILEQSELALGSDEESQIRDLLLQAQTDGGLLERDVRDLRQAVQMTNKPKRLEVLPRILERFGITTDDWF